MDQPLLITQRRVAEEFGIPISTQEDLRAKGAFCQPLRVGLKIYYWREELVRFLEAQRVTAAVVNN